MSSPFYGSQPSVEGWLDGQYEYMVPDKDIDEHTDKSSYMPRDAYRDYTPELSDENSSTGKRHRSSRDQHHSSAKERYTPLSPPPEKDLDKGRDTYHHSSGQAHRRDRAHEADREERRTRHDRDTKYPPKADHGRRRPPLNTATTSPHLTSGRPTTDEEHGKRRHRRYSQTSSPPPHFDDRSSRHHHTRRQGKRSPSPPPRRTPKKKDVRDRETRSNHGSSSSSNTKPHRPSLSRSQTAPFDKDPKKSNSSGRSFSFLNDPRVMTAAEAALQAGATAALASGGGKWGKDKGAKVLGAGLSAAALSALKPPAVAEATPAPPPPPPPRASETAGDRAGRYAAGHVGRREGARRRHH